MPKITFLPHALCPTGAIIDAQAGETILDVALQHNIYLEHACERQCACATCHCIVRKGGDSLSEISEREEDMLDNAWGVQSDSRLSCQAKIGEADITVEIPLYSVNHAREE